MSGAAEDPDETELLAGEYVLGVLDAAAMAQVRATAAEQAELALAIAAWEQRLGPLAELALPVAPPAALWPRIAASLEAASPEGASLGAAAPKFGASNDNAGRPGRVWRSVALWRGTTAAALALAAGFAAVTLLRPPPPLAVATLAPAGAPGAVFVASLSPDGTVLLRPLAPVAVPTDRDLELWALAAGAARPVSLGVITPAGRQVRSAGLTAGTQLLVSLEPKGGSPTGQPTGPVVYAGRLAMME